MWYIPGGHRIPGGVHRRVLCDGGCPPQVREAPGERLEEASSSMFAAIRPWATGGSSETLPHKVGMPQKLRRWRSSVSSSSRMVYGGWRSEAGA